MNEEVSPTAKALFEKLRAFYNDGDFVLGIMCNAPHEDDMKTILEYIEKGKDVTRGKPNTAFSGTRKQKRY